VHNKRHILLVPCFLYFVLYPRISQMGYIYQKNWLDSLAAFFSILFNPTLKNSGPAHGRGCNTPLSDPASAYGEWRSSYDFHHLLTYIHVDCMTTSRTLRSRDCTGNRSGSIYAVVECACLPTGVVSSP